MTTLTDVGIHNISGASLKTAVDALTGTEFISGLYFIPCAGGQQVLVVGIS